MAMLRGQVTTRGIRCASLCTGFRRSLSRPASGRDTDKVSPKGERVPWGIFAGSGGAKASQIACAPGRKSQKDIVSLTGF